MGEVEVCRKRDSDLAAFGGGQKNPRGLIY